MGELIRIKDEIAMKCSPTPIEQINRYAQQHGVVKKNGAFYAKDGKFIGGLFAMGKMAGIDLQDGK